MVAKRIAPGSFMVIMSVTLSGTVQEVKYVGTNISLGCIDTHIIAHSCKHIRSLTSLLLTHVNYVTVSSESPPQSYIDSNTHTDTHTSKECTLTQSWQITLSTGCPTSGGCYDSVSSDEERCDSPTRSHWTPRPLLLSCYQAALFHLALWGFVAEMAAKHSLSEKDFNPARSHPAVLFSACWGIRSEWGSCQRSVSTHNEFDFELWCLILVFKPALLCFFYMLMVD